MLSEYNVRKNDCEVIDKLDCLVATERYRFLKNFFLLRSQFDSESFPVQRSLSYFISKL